MRKVTDMYISAFCRELALIVAAGIPLSDGLMMMRDDDNDKASREIINRLYLIVDKGEPLSEALTETSVFPEYLGDMILLAERTGRLENTLNALSEHYARQERLKSSVRSAVFYPVILLVIMLVVIVVLVTQVLPIFNEVFNQMGAEMSPLALGLMNAGRALNNASAVIGIVILAILAVSAVSVLIPAARHAVTRFFKLRFGGKGVFGRAVSARFASAMSMAAMSGMDTEEAIELAARFCRGTKETDLRLEKCRSMLGAGKKASEALSASGLFSQRESRMLAISEETGSMSVVLGEIAARGESAAMEDIESMVRKIEPSMVIITSVLVGSILLSVMLPLASIMSSIG